VRATQSLLIAILFLPGVAALTPSDTNIYPGEPFSVVHCEDISQTCSDITVDETRSWNESCSITAYDTSDTSCQQTTIRSDYDSSIIEIQNYESLLSDRVENQGRSQTSLSIAERLRAKAQLNESFESEQRALKQIRDNDYKCWPNGDCKISTTTKILKHLDHAGFDDDNRIYADGLRWIESQQNQFTNENWTLRINPDFSQTDECPNKTESFEDGNKTKCYIATGNQSTDTLDPVETNEEARCTASVGNDEVYDESSDTGPFTTQFEYEANAVLNISCDVDFTVRVTDFFGDTKYVANKEVDETAQYLLPGGCWPSDDNERICSIKTTALALTVDGLSAQSESEGQEWVESNIQRSRITGERLQDEESVLSHLYLYEATANENLREWLLYRQNNDGSFGDTNRLHTTLEALRIFNDNTEWINDAKEWAQSQQTSDLLEATLYYEQFKPDQPVSSFNPSLLSVGRDGGSSSVNPNLSNPDISTTNPLDNVVEAFYDDSGVDVEVTDQETGLTQGYVNLRGETTDYELPVVVDIEPSLSIEYNRSYYHQAPQGTIQPSVSKSDDPMNCTVTHSAFYDFVDQNLQDNTNIVIPYSNASEGTQTVNSVTTCETPHGTVTDQSTFQATHYPTPPFTASVTSDNVSQVETLTVTNQLPENITVRSSFEQDALYYRVPTEITIPPNHHADIPLYQDTAVQEQQVDENTVELLSKGYRATVPLTYQLNNQTQSVSPRFEVEENTSYAAWFALLALLISLGAAAYVYVITRENEEEDSVDQHDEEVALAEVDAYLNDVLGEGREKTEEELREQGFDEDVIDETDSFLNDLNDSLDEAIGAEEDNV
jgi:hypothetical protein